MTEEVRVLVIVFMVQILGKYMLIRCLLGLPYTLKSTYWFRESTSMQVSDAIEGLPNPAPAHMPCDQLPLGESNMKAGVRARGSTNAC